MIRTLQFPKMNAVPEPTGQQQQTGGRKPMVDIQTPDITGGESKAELQLIHGYGDGGFRVSSKRHEGDLILLPRATNEWTIPPLEKLCFADLQPWLGTIPPLFVLGTGAPPQSQYAALAKELKANGIALEVMSTPAACRTWNVLMTEGRQVAAALVAI